MDERQTGCMQKHPLCWGVAIERVAKYRSLQSVRVGTVNSQLVCSASEWKEPHPVFVCKLISRYRLFAFFVIHSLHGAILKIRGEGEGDNPTP